DRPGDVDNRLEQLAERILRGQHARRDRRAQVVAHRLPPTFDAVVSSTVFSWNGKSRGCLERTSAQIPLTCGAANELPVTRSAPPPSRAASISPPRAYSSTGGAGFA